MEDEGCICKGNWRLIVKEAEPFLNEPFLDENGKQFIFFGIVHSKDDYYYGVIDQERNVKLLSCVGSLETHGYTYYDWRKNVVR